MRIAKILTVLLGMLLAGVVTGLGTGVSRPEPVQAATSHEWVMDSQTLPYYHPTTNVFVGNLTWTLKVRARYEPMGWLPYGALRGLGTYPTDVNDPEFQKYSAQVVLSCPANFGVQSGMVHIATNVKASYPNGSGGVTVVTQPIDWGNPVIGFAPGSNTMRLGNFNAFQVPNTFTAWIAGQFTQTGGGTAGTLVYADEDWSL
jgi:hypothetical protein